MSLLRVDVDLRAMADMFARGPYVGGYDADERAFCFGYTDKDQELWFQFTLDEAKAIAAGERSVLDARKPPAKEPQRSRCVRVT